MSYQPSNDYKYGWHEQFIADGILKGFALDRVCLQCGKTFGAHIGIDCPGED